MDGEEELLGYSKEIAKGSVWGLVGSISLKLVSFLYAILIARAASQGDVGIFYLAISIITIPSVIDDLGLPGALVRYIPYFAERNEKGKIRDLLKMGYTCIFFSSLLLFGLLFWQADNFGAIYQNSHLPFAIKILSVFLIFNNLLSMNSSFFQSSGDIRSMQSVQNTQNVFKLILSAAFFYLFGASILTLSAAFILSFLIAILASVPSVIKKFSLLPLDKSQLTNNEFIREIIPFGITLSVIGSLWSLISSADRLLLGYLTPSATAAELVAVYSIATTFAGVLSIFPASIGSIFLPLMSRLAAKNDLSKMRSMMETANRWVLLITIPVAVMFIGFSSQMLGQFYGPSYAGGGEVMAIFTLGLLISALAYVVSIAFAAIRMIKLEFKITVVVAIVNVLFNFLLIPIYGMIGSAVASVIGFLVMVVLFSYYGKKTFGFTFPYESYKLILAGFVMFFLVMLIKPLIGSASFVLPQLTDAALSSYASKILYLLLIGIVFAFASLVFVLFAILLKCFKKEDVSILKKGLIRLKMPLWVVDFSEKIFSFGTT
ncbi:flippase [Candidatus Micrarchaeota archaeon]|nr:flippase [Candidatus Micrarchaeota archaeon]